MQETQPGVSDHGAVGNWQRTIDAVRNCSDADLERIVAAAKPHVLRICLLQLTKDDRLRHMRVTPSAIGPSARVVPTVDDPEDVAWLRSRMVEVLRGYRNGTVGAPLPGRFEFQALLEMLFGHEFAAWEMDLWWEEFAAVPHPRGCSWFGSLSSDDASRFRVVVIGAGMNGITSAVNLERAGIPYTVLERNDGVGGTWHANRYPGARVDIASRCYSYSWEPGWKWEHRYALRDELKAYFDHVVDKYGIREHIQLCTEVREAVWDESAQQWVLVVRDTRTGERSTLRAHVLISGIGIFSRPRIPDIPGLEHFEGRVMHTVEWDRSVDLAGKRIATIGTGSSGVQIVAPLAAEAKQLYVFQRSGTWIDPVPDYVDPVPEAEQWLLDNVPYYLNWERILSVFPLSDHRIGDPRLLDIDPEWTEPGTISAWNKQFRERLMNYLREKIGDRPDLLERCVPDYPPLSKRLPKDNGWFDALREDHVELVSDRIERFTRQGIRTASGDEYVVDVIVLATGFKANDFLLSIDLVGRGGLTLRERWASDGARAYLGITIPGFPNLFCMYGPNTNGRASGPCSWGELQSRYAMESIKYMIDHDRRSMDVKEEVYRAFNELLDERSRLMPWMSMDQRSYYRNDFGRSATNGPFMNRDYWPWTRHPNPDDFIFV